MKEFWAEMEDMEKILVMASVFIILGTGVSIFLSTYFEMKSFNKFSTKQATYVDAFFSNLRIDPQ